MSNSLHGSIQLPENQFQIWFSQTMTYLFLFIIYKKRKECIKKGLLLFKLRFGFMPSVVIWKALQSHWISLNRNLFREPWETQGPSFFHLLSIPTGNYHKSHKRQEHGELSNRQKAFARTLADLSNSVKRNQNVLSLIIQQVSDSAIVEERIKHFRIKAPSSTLKALGGSDY